MGTKGWTKKLAVAALGVAALLMTTSPADSAISTIAVKGFVVSGGIVQVTLKNTSALPFVGTLAVEANVNGLQVWSFVPMTLSGGQCATISAAFTGAVSDVITVGMTDDPNPL
jgi:hypothetical protein